VRSVTLRAEPLLSLAAQVAGEHRATDVLDAIVRGLSIEPGVALARIWLRETCATGIAHCVPNVLIRQSVFTWLPVPAAPKTKLKIGRRLKGASNEFLGGTARLA